MRRLDQMSPSKSIIKNYVLIKSLLLVSYFFLKEVRKSNSIDNFSINATTIDFINSLLTLYPGKRLSAKEALNHVFFHSEPYPCE